MDMDRSTKRRQIRQLMMASQPRPSLILEPVVSIQSIAVLNIKSREVVTDAEQGWYVTRPLSFKPMVSPRVKTSLSIKDSQAQLPICPLNHTASSNMEEREKLEAVQIHARRTDSSDYSISSRSSSVTNVLDHSDIKSSTFDKFDSTNRPATEENLYDSVSASEYQNNERTTVTITVLQVPKMTQQASLRMTEPGCKTGIVRLIPNNSSAMCLEVLPFSLHRQSIVYSPGSARIGLNARE
jgi:hypothetical protein